MRKVVLPLITIALILLGLSFYLHSIDHVTIIRPHITTHSTTMTTTVTNITEAVEELERALRQVSTPLVSGQYLQQLQSKYHQTTVIPPPWYANLWPETLTVGIVLLVVALLLLRPKFSRETLDKILEYI